MVPEGLHTGRDTLDTTTASEPPDSGLRDALDVVPKNLAVALSTTLSEALAALAAFNNVSTATMRSVTCRPSTYVQSCWV